MPYLELSSKTWRIQDVNSSLSGSKVCGLYPTYCCLQSKSECLILSSHKSPPQFQKQPLTPHLFPPHRWNSVTQEPQSLCQSVWHGFTALHLFSLNVFWFVHIPFTCEAQQRTEFQIWTDELTKAKPSGLISPFDLESKPVVAQFRIHELCWQPWHNNWLTQPELSELCTLVSAKPALLFPYGTICCFEPQFRIFPLLISIPFNKHPPS